MRILLVERHHIFERFYRADRARTRAEDGGAGLGLAIARWIARAHDGDIELDDSGTAGTKFIVRLPFTNGKGTLR
jgi:two-component system OmpR family sensor kinase